MSKKILSMLLALVMLLSAVSVGAEEENNINVFLSVSRYGEVVKDKNGESMAYFEINLNGKSSYNLNDVFLAAHVAYYDDGEIGYASSESEWGFGIDKFWGDDSGNFGYQVNGGAETVMGLGYEVSDGDCIDAFIYKNAYPDTEGYAMFNMTHTEAFAGSEFELVLQYFSGYDENWNNIISPCADATITVNGEETEFITDESGKAIIKLENAGINVISATKKKVLNDKEVPAITAPVCVVNTKVNPAIEIIHNIAQQYTQIDYSEKDTNLPWIIADMLVYEELFPDSENILNEMQKQTALKTIADLVSNAEKPGDLAKYILALRALGYDAKTVYTEDFKSTDAVKKLTELIEAKDESVTNVYTLPYVIIALSQADEYATETRMNWLIDEAIKSKASWQTAEFGTDGMTPMILALAPYADSNETVKAVLDETIGVLKSEQREDGLIDGFEGYEPASTGLAICALSAAGIDADGVKNGEKSLVSGLISVANEELNGFSNAFATEQAFRGLLAWRLMADNKEKIMYDFSDYSMYEANVSGFEYCPIIFNVSPKNAEITIEGKEPVLNNCFDLDAGMYEYKIFASGYISETGEIKITADEAKYHLAKTIKISLKEKSFGGGGSSSDKLNNKDKIEVNEPEKKEAEQTKPENEEEFNEKTFADVKSSDWYYPSVQYVYENKLFNGTDKGFEPSESMTRAMLVTVLYRLDAPEKTYENYVFGDVVQGAWYSQGVNWAAENQIVNGVSDSMFAPDNSITREQLAVILYRYAMYKGYDITVKDKSDISVFSDSNEISSYAADAISYVTAIGVMNGRDKNTIAPSERVTRAEVATMLMRFAEIKG